MINSTSSLVVKQDLPGTTNNMQNSCINKKIFFFRDDNSPVTLKFFENDRRIQEAVYGRRYQVKAEITHPNGTQGIRVKNCFAFNKKNNTIALIDDRGLVDTFKVMIKIIKT